MFIYVHKYSSSGFSPIDGNASQAEEARVPRRRYRLGGVSPVAYWALVTVAIGPPSEPSHGLRISSVQHTKNFLTLEARKEDVRISTLSQHSAHSQAALTGHFL